MLLCWKVPVGGYILVLILGEFPAQPSFEHDPKFRIYFDVLPKNKFGEPINSQIPLDGNPDGSHLRPWQTHATTPWLNRIRS